MVRNVLPASQWLVEVSQCDNGGAGTSGFDLVVFRNRNGVNINGAVVTYETTVGAPVHLTGSEVFVQSPESMVVAGSSPLVYSVPDECVFRLASTPLQRVRRLEDGSLVSSIHTGVPKSVIRMSELWKASPSDPVCGVGCIAAPGCVC